MAKRSDFAQKLLDDLRQRKERMATSQNSKGTNSVVTDAYTYSKKTYKSSREPKTLKTTGHRAGSTENRASGASKLITNGQASSQIVPFGRGQKTDQIGDLSMALAFALENGGKLKRTDSSGNSSMFSFLHNIGKRQMDYGKMEKRNSIVSRHRPSSSQIPTLSNLHIEEISRGAQKLNQILRACSNGLNFDRYSIEIGRELLQGAMDLEESLRMLVNLQEASDYLVTPQRKSRITLIDEDEDDDDDDIQIADQRQLNRPIFSFDRRSRNYNDIQEVARTDLKLRLAALTYSSDITHSKHERKVPAASNAHSHKRSVSYGSDFRTLSTFSEQNHSSSSQSNQDKSRIPSVIAKLMGLEELPGNVDSKVITQKGPGKEKVERMVTKKPAQVSTKKSHQRTKDTPNQVPPPVKQKTVSTNKMPLIQDTVTSQAGKTLTSRNNSTRVAVHEKSPARKPLEDIKSVTSLRKATTIKVDKQQSDHSQLMHNSVSRKEIQEKERKQDIKYREERGAERNETNDPVFQDERQQMAPYMHKSEAAHVMREKQEYNGSMLRGENRYANKLLLENQQKLQNSPGFQQVHMLQKSELQYKRHQTEEREENNKQKLKAKKQKGNDPISSNSSKPMSGAIDSQKQQQQQQNQEATGRKSTEHNDAIKFNGFPDGRHQENTAKYVSSTNLNSKMKDSIDRNYGQHYSDKHLEPESAKANVPIAVDEKPTQVQTTMKTKGTKAHKIEVHRKMNDILTKKGGSVYNLPRTLKHQRSILQEGKQITREKLAISREANQMKPSRFEEVEAQIIRSNKSVASLQASDVPQSQQKAAVQNSILCSPQHEECQSLNETQVSALKDRCQNEEPMVTKEQQEQEPHFGRTEEDNIKTIASDPEHRTREETTEISNSLQSKEQRAYTSELQEPLTESEDLLKQILMKSQLFMNTAEALFKLNIPSNILHANGHDYHNQESKLVLDCGYEVMKRKGRRQELRTHPFLKLSITSNKVKSLDDLVKQMCKDFDKLKLYGRDGREDSPLEDYLPKMLEADVYSKEPDLNCMWDLGWNSKKFEFLEKDEVIRDVEKYVLNGLLDEITIDLFTVSVSI